jgi:hypothetical protein
MAIEWIDRRANGLNDIYTVLTNSLPQNFRTDYLNRISAKENENKNSPNELRL